MRKHAEELSEECVTKSSSSKGIEFTRPMSACVSPPSGSYSPRFKYHCSLCNKGFVDERQLTMHEKEIHEVPCTSCDKSFFTEFDLDLHIITSHSPSLPELENSSTPKHEASINVIESENGNSIELCKTLSCNNGSGELKIPGHHESCSNESCYLCDIPVRSPSELKEHIQDVHITPALSLSLIAVLENLEPKLSNYEATPMAKPALVPNQIAASPETYFECEFCEFKTKKFSVLSTHAKTHTTVHKCDECPFTTS